MFTIYILKLMNQYQDNFTWSVRIQWKYGMCLSSEDGASNCDIMYFMLKMENKSLHINQILCCLLHDLLGPGTVDLTWFGGEGRLYINVKFHSLCSTRCLDLRLILLIIVQNCSWFSLKLQWNECYQILRVPIQHRCHGMCKYLLQSDHKQVNYSKINYPLNLSCEWKIISEMGPWIWWDVSMQKTHLI